MTTMATDLTACRRAFLDLEQELLILASRALSLAELAHQLGTDRSGPDDDR